MVLIVDDNEDIRRLYGRYLAYQGMSVETAEDGTVAVRKAMDLLPDVIVLDLMMPGMTGFEAMEMLKANPSTRHIKIITLTASHEPEARSAAIAAGTDAFLTKPCLPDELFAEIRRALTS